MVHHLMVFFLQAVIVHADLHASKMIERVVVLT